MKTPTTGKAESALPLREAQLPPKLRELRQKLSQKAKQQKRYRFYSLFGLLCRAEVLQAAWEAVQRNGGSPGVDGLTIAQIAATPESQARFLVELQQSLVERTYRAQAVRRVYIPKANGKVRPLGIPTVRDRVVQAAVLLILEPIFEADFEDCSYGFRPGRSAHDALRAIHQYLKEGYTEVYDADLAGYFDSIPHDKLMACVRMRVVDGSVLALIRQWLRAPVIEPPPRTGSPPPCGRRDRGTPQGGVLSPLLANVYLHWFDRAFHRANGPAKWANAKLVRYADDFVVLARHVGQRVQRYIEDKLEHWLLLEINREKTRVIDLRQDGQSLDFLGFTFRYERDRYGRRQRFWNLEPSAKSVQRERAVLRQKTGPERCWVPLPELIEHLNRHRAGWGNYFRLGNSRKAFSKLNAFIQLRLAGHLRRRSQRGWRAPQGESHYAYFVRMGLKLL